MVLASETSMVPGSETSNTWCLDSPRSASFYPEPADEECTVFMIFAEKKGTPMIVPSSCWPLSAGLCYRLFFRMPNMLYGDRA